MVDASFHGAFPYLVSPVCNFAQPIVTRCASISSSVCGSQRFLPVLLWGIDRAWRAVLQIAGKSSALGGPWDRHHRYFCSSYRRFGRRDGCEQAVFWLARREGLGG
jgi:hypothetical protein